MSKMTDTVLHTCDAWTVLATPFATSCRVHIRMCRRASGALLEEMMSKVVDHVRAAPQSCVMHIEHVDSDSLDPPDLPCMMQIVGQLLQHKDLVEKKLLGTCVQAKTVDDAARVAADLFQSMWQTDALLVVDTQEATDKFLRKMTRRLARVTAPP